MDKRAVVSSIGILYAAPCYACAPMQMSLGESIWLAAQALAVLLAPVCLIIHGAFLYRCRGSISLGLRNSIVRWAAILPFALVIVGLLGLGAGVLGRELTHWRGDRLSIWGIQLLAVSCVALVCTWPFAFSILWHNRERSKDRS